MPLFDACQEKSEILTRFLRFVYRYYQFFHKNAGGISLLFLDSVLQ